MSGIHITKDRLIEMRIKVKLIQVIELGWIYKDQTERKRYLIIINDQFRFETERITSDSLKEGLLDGVLYGKLIDGTNFTNQIQRLELKKMGSGLELSKLIYESRTQRRDIERYLFFCLNFSL